MLTVKDSLNNEQASTNKCYMKDPQYPVVNIEGFLFDIEHDDKCTGLHLNGIARRIMKITNNEREISYTFQNKPETEDFIVTIDNFLSKPTRDKIIYDEKKLLEILMRFFNGKTIDSKIHYIFTLDGFYFTVIFEGVNNNFGVLNQIVKIKTTPKVNQVLTIKRESMVNLSFEGMDIGGMNEQLTTILRRIFSSRLQKKSTIDKLGINHVKGLILYGPPGTGKTLIARKFAEKLECSSVTIVNGPEIMDKFVGESERKMRDVFSKAEEAKGEGLHIIIFDEIDSICRSRGDSKLTDGIVNQLLTKMDGVESINNVLIIGMTNRLDLIDGALLRPGRFEVKIKISLPDYGGRLEIFNIHTQKLKSTNALAEDVNAEVICSKIVNYTGAEIAGFVRMAISFAFSRNIVKDSHGHMVSNDNNIMVTMEDFENSMKEFEPMFAKKIPVVTEEILPFQYQIIKNRLYFIDDGNDPKKLAYHFKYPNTIIINNYIFIGNDSTSKSLKLKTFIVEALVGDNSVVIFENMEQIIEYYHINGAFTTPVATAIRTLLHHEFDRNIIFIISCKNHGNVIKNILDIDMTKDFMTEIFEN